MVPGINNEYTSSTVLSFTHKERKKENTHGFSSGKILVDIKTSLEPKQISEILEIRNVELFEYD